MRLVMIGMLCVLAGPALAQDKEKFAGSNVDVRTIIGFKAQDSAIQKFLPAGWQPAPGTGPNAGINLRLVLIEQIFAADAENKPTEPARLAVANASAKKADMAADVPMVITGLATAGAPGAYLVYAPAKAAMERETEVKASGGPKAQENWEFRGDGGDAVRIELEYEKGIPARSDVEAKVYSGAKPDFYRIYRFDQATDVVRNINANLDRVKKFQFRAEGPKFGPLFEKAEVISITSVPFYNRKYYLPASM
jgi:hypothetical protein